MASIALVWIQKYEEMQLRSIEKGLICLNSFKKPCNRQRFAFTGKNSDVEARMTDISKINSVEIV